MLPTEPDTPETWLAWLRHEYPDARQVGALHLGLMLKGNPDTWVLPNLHDAILNEREDAVRLDLIRAIELIDRNCERSASIMLRLLTDTDETVRKYAVEDLGRIKPTPSHIFTALQAVWSADSDEGVRAAAALTLVRERAEPSMVGPLCRILVEATNAFDRDMAAYALAGLGQYTQPFRGILEQVALLDMDDEVREHAARALLACDQGKRDLWYTVPQGQLSE
jgi:HEAT repeat protein